MGRCSPVPLRLAVVHLAVALLDCAGDQSVTAQEGSLSAGDFSGTEVSPIVGHGGDTDADFPGLRVKGRHLYDRCGEKVILRGVNDMTVWVDRGGNAFAEMAKTGANTVRIVWLAEEWVSLQALDTILSRAITSQLIPIVELHDATCDWSGLEALVDWWVQPAVVAIVRKYEKNLLVNIGNEVGDGRVSGSRFFQGYAEAITRMREAGYRTPLIIDASQCGQDIDIIQSQGPALLAHDPFSNLLFSVHLWWPSAWHDSSSGWGSVEERVSGEIAQSVDMSLPLLIGEFAPMASRCTESIPYRLIMQEAQEHEIGWLAWSWSPGNRDCGSMDMTTDGTVNTLWGWGLEVALEDANSIANTSVRPFSMVHGTCPPTGGPLQRAHPTGPHCAASSGR